MRKRIISILLCLVMVMSLLPTAVFAVDEQPAGSEIYVDANNTSDGDGTKANPYKDVATAVNNAKSGDTIQLAAGTYTLYNKNANVENKNLTFVGAGTKETTWNIGTPENDADDQNNGDFGFEGAKTLVFQNMTLKSGVTPSGNVDGGRNYMGFTHTDKTIVEKCVIEGKTCYWGYTSAMFKDTTFNCPSGDYALWTYCSPEMTFDGCTFNASGKIINVYTDYSADKDIVVNFKDCTVNNSAFKKQVLKINDSNKTNGSTYTINISGKNVINNTSGDPAKDVVEPNEITCSRLFGFDEAGENAGKTTVYIEGEKVWENGERVGSHNHDFTTGSYNNGVATDDANKYTDGYKDDAFTTTYGSWGWDQNKNQLARTVTKICNYCGETVETTEYKDLDLDVSRSKTATELDSNDQSTVTLSLPSAEEAVESDIVFVIDGSSSVGSQAVDKSLAMLNVLKESADKSGAAVNVCVVKFKRQAFKSDWFDLSTQYESIKNAMEEKYSGGTNIEAGLLAGKAALDEDTEVSAARKYLILISDGSTYLYSKGGDWSSNTPYTRSYHAANPYNSVSGGFYDESIYCPSNGGEYYNAKNVVRPSNTSDPDAWKAYLEDVGERNKESSGDKYDYHCNYDLNFNQGIASSDFVSQPCVGRSASNRDMALYYADKAWQSIKSAGYNAYSIRLEDEAAKDSACTTFMDYLNDGATLNFDDVKSEVLYAVGADSTVEDKMGADFNFVTGSLKLTVGGTELASKTEGDVTYFGAKDTAQEIGSENYRFKVEYDSTNDKFTWMINENVSNFAPVQLSYKVELVNRSTAAGTYKVFTNEYATLTPMNSAGQVGKELEFDKPEVSYTVKNSSGGGGGGGGNSKPVVIPDKVPTGLNGDDHYAYIVGYPDSTVRPQNGITRAEVATIFFRLLTDEVRDKNSTKTNSYSDVASTDWYNHAVSTLSAMGIIKGDTHGKFNPNAPITRAEFAAIAARFDDNANTTTADFSDIASHWAKDEISAAANNGWINGYTDGTFRPDNNITRAEAMTLVNRVLKRLPETAEDLYDGMIKWSDNSDTSKWYYLAVQEATNSHYYETKNTQYEKWTKLRETRDWTELEK